MTAPRLSPATMCFGQFYSSNIWRDQREAFFSLSRSELLPASLSAKSTFEIMLQEPDASQIPTFAYCLRKGTHCYFSTTLILPFSALGKKTFHQVFGDLWEESLWSWALTPHGKKMGTGGPNPNSDFMI